MPITLSVGSEFSDDEARKVVKEAEAYFKRQGIEVKVKAKMDEAAARKAAFEAKQYFERQGVKVDVDVDLDRSAFRRADGALVGLINRLNEVGRATAFTSRGLATIAAPVAGIALIDIAKGAVTASQSIALLPAVVGAAAAGFGTLKLATLGFGDAMDNMGDPKKFAESLQSLSPNAQQAALSIQNLVDGPLKDLKTATQDALFSGVGEQLQRLTNEYLPELKTMTTSIAGSFNDMFKGITDQLMTPDTQAAMSNAMTNIAAAFKEITPALPALTQAFTVLMSAGSEFLPELARSAAAAATAFAEFITEAEKSGSLREFIQNGIDAVGVFADAIFELGRILYQVFGVDGKKNVEDLRDTLQGINQVIGLLTMDTKTWGDTSREQFGQMTGLAATVRDAWLDIPEAMATAFNFIIDQLNGLKNLIFETLIRPLNEAINIANLLPGADIPQITWRPGDIGHVPPGGDWASGAVPGGIPGGGAPFAQAQRRGAASGTDWDAIAQKESDGNWAANTGNGYFGGLQFLPETWRAYGGTGMPNEASKEEQIRVAENVLRGQGPGAWPNTYKFGSPKAGLGAYPSGGFSMPSVPAASSGSGSGAASGPMGTEPQFADIAAIAESFGLTITSGQRNEPGSFHNAGEAGDFGMPGGGRDTPQMLAFAAFMRQNYGAQLDELIYHGPGFSGQQIDNGKTVSDATFAGAGDHHDHVHVALTDALRDQGFVPDQLGGTPGANWFTGAGPRGARGSSGGASALTGGVNGPPGSGIPVFVTNMPGSGLARGSGGGLLGGLGGFGGGAGGAGGAGGFDPLGAFFSGLSEGGGILGPVGGLGNNILGMVRSQTFDKGGWIDPGITLAQNNTGVPEQVLPPGAPGGDGGIGSGGGLGGGIGGGIGKSAGAVEQTGPTKIGGGESKTSPGAAQSGGGVVGAATAAGAMAADAFAPGSGAAVQIASQEAQRAIKFGAQAVAIGAQGVLDTILPFGGSDFAQNNWISRIASGFSGAKPQAPNLAGKSSSTDAMAEAPGAQGPGGGVGGSAGVAMPAAPGKEKGGGVGGSVVNNITYNNNNAPEDRAGADLMGHLRRGYENVAIRGNR